MNLTMSIRMAIRFPLERWDIHAFEVLYMRSARVHAVTERKSK